MTTGYIMIALTIVVVAYLRIFDGLADLISSYGYSAEKTFSEKLNVEAKAGRIKIFKFGVVILVVLFFLLAFI